MQEYSLTSLEFELFRKLIHKLTGISLNDGKRQLVQSRLQKRLRHLNLATFTEYYALVEKIGPNDSEYRPFVNCITTNKTDFFRESHHFEFVSTVIIPEMIEDLRRGRRDKKVRIWHAGCSTGEEPYTLAITLAESALADGQWDIRQLASDIDTDVLKAAQSGIYSEDKTEPIGSSLLRKYFLRRSTDGTCLYKVRPELAEQITFKCINLLEEHWPIGPKVQFDMIFCRNVVIYFDKSTQRRLFARFADLLRPGGYLFIGHSESLLGISDSFDSVGQTIYQLAESVSSSRAA